MEDKRKNEPNEPGRYWARMGVEGWFNLIVQVEGSAPMLQIGWALRLNGLDAPKLIKPGPWQIDEWSSEKILSPDERDRAN